MFVRLRLESARLRKMRVMPLRGGYETIRGHVLEYTRRRRIVKLSDRQDKVGRVSMILMKIEKIELFHIAIPLKEPFETSFGVIDKRPALIIKMTSDDGFVGYGESSPLYVPISEQEILEDSIKVFGKILPKLIGLPVERDFDITQKYEPRENPVSVIGIEGAYLDLVARKEGVPVRDLFAGQGKEVRVGESVGIHSSIEETLQKVQAYVDRGFGRIKVKIAPNKDIEVIKAVRNQFPDLLLGADANAVYTREDMDILARLAEFDLAFLEQPFGADDLESNILLRKSGILICLDETVIDLESCRKAVEVGACNMMNIKPARIGSFKESMNIHDYCLRSGIKLFGGGRLETGVGKTLNANFYSLPGFSEPSDLTPPADYFEEDITEPPFLVENGLVKLFDLAGIGVNLGSNSVAYTKESWTF